MEGQEDPLRSAPASTSCQKFPWAALTGGSCPQGPGFWDSEQGRNGPGGRMLSQQLTWRNVRDARATKGRLMTRTETPAAPTPIPRPLELRGQQGACLPPSLSFPEVTPARPRTRPVEGRLQSCHWGREA